jgi:hypothetical protein
MNTWQKWNNQSWTPRGLKFKRTVEELLVFAALFVVIFSAFYVGLTSW